jgi:hypothetical protein
MLTSENNPIVFKSKPLSTSNGLIVDRINVMGNPELIPKRNMIIKFLKDLFIEKTKFLSKIIATK